jgi:hypothetical protein
VLLLNAETIRGTLREVLGRAVAQTMRSNETTRAFACDASQLQEHVLLRHLIEHVNRIRSFRALDARAMQLLTGRHPAAAAIWGQYARSEAVHDRYFLRDLGAIGVDRSIVDATPPFPSTAALIRFIGGAMRWWGPLPVILYSFWAEENSDAGTSAIVERIRGAFGPQAVRGASAHRRLDETLDHTGVVSEVLVATIRTVDDLQSAAELISAITELIGDYFADLDRWRRQPVPPAWPQPAKIRVAASV